MQDRVLKNNEQRTNSGRSVLSRRIRVRVGVVFRTLRAEAVHPRGVGESGDAR